MELTRKELYDLVWSEPMTTICKRFGLSDNGLRKRCKSMNIPTPPLGYWAKLKYGKQVTPLPFQQEETNATQSTTLQEAKEPKVEMEKSVNHTSNVNWKFAVVIFHALRFQKSYMLKIL